MREENEEGSRVKLLIFSIEKDHARLRSEVQRRESAKRQSRYWSNEVGPKSDTNVESPRDTVAQERFCAAGASFRLAFNVCAAGDYLHPSWYEWSRGWQLCRRVCESGYVFSNSGLERIFFPKDDSLG